MKIFMGFFIGGVYATLLNMLLMSNRTAEALFLAVAQIVFLPILLALWED